MIKIGIILLLPALVVVWDDWRRWLFVAVPVAILQDPLRKLTPGQPVSFVLLVGAVVCVAMVAAAAKSGVSLQPNRIREWNRYLAVPFGLFIAVLLFQALNSLYRFGSVSLPIIGLMNYLTP